MWALAYTDLCRTSAAGVRGRHWGCCNSACGQEKSGMRKRSFQALLMVAAAVGFSAVPARADLVINSAGAALGFTVSNFATGLPNTGMPYGQGPFGITVVANGSGGTNVLLEDFAGSGNLYIFNNADGQTPATALKTISGFQS